jgi:hypothetical protein
MAVVVFAMGSADVAACLGVSVLRYRAVFALLFASVLTAISKAFIYSSSSLDYVLKA